MKLATYKNKAGNWSIKPSTTSRTGDGVDLATVKERDVAERIIDRWNMIEKLAAAFPGLTSEEPVNGADLVEWLTVRMSQ